MRTATLIAETVAVMCPACRDAICEPTTGSEMWTAEDLDRHHGRKLECDGCGLFTMLPAKKPERVRLL